MGGREGFVSAREEKKNKIPQKIYSVPKVGNESGH
jgi:hypothetical protein